MTALCIYSAAVISMMLPSLKRFVRLSTVICPICGLLILVNVFSPSARFQNTGRQHVITDAIQFLHRNRNMSRISDLKGSSAGKASLSNHGRGADMNSRLQTTAPVTLYYTNRSIQSISDLREHLVSLTAVSDNHVHEVQGMLISLQHCLPDKKIIIYDLGLNTSNRKQLSSYGNVELRHFPFDDYSHIPHVRDLHTYAWKPIIIKLVTQEYDVIMYGDACLRMKQKHCKINKALSHILYNFPLFMIHPIGHRVIEFTHDGMIEYLHYPKARQDIAHIETLEASAFLLWVTDTMRDKVIEPWLDCAIHQECIAPEGAKLTPCKFTAQHDGHYVGCHRYDQSAINLILLREFGPDNFQTFSNRGLSAPLWGIEKEPE